MPEKKTKSNRLFLDMSKIKAAVERQLHISTIEKNEIFCSDKYIRTGVSGFDDLIEKGIPIGSNIIVVGGVGCGKTIFCLQTLAYNVTQGKKCLYMSFEEPILKFLSNIGNKLKESGCRGLFYALDIKDHRVFIQEASMIADKVLNLGIEKIA